MHTEPAQSPLLIAIPFFLFHSSFYYSFKNVLLITPVLPPLLFLVLLVYNIGILLPSRGMAWSPWQGSEDTPFQQLFVG